MNRRARVLLATESLRAAGSGIGRVARLMALTLAERSRTGLLQFSALALNGAEPTNDLGTRSRTAAGSRPRFVAQVQLAALRHTHFMYDFAGMGRAHPWYWRPRRPYLVWIHGSDIWEHTRADRLRVARTASVLVANTEYTRERADKAHGGLSQAKVCWLGTETDAEPTHTNGDSQQPSVLILGRIDSHGGSKGHRELIDAWPQVIAAVPDARLLIAGSGSGGRELESHANRSSARANIEIRGYIEEGDVEALWSEACVFAMPSVREGFGLAYIEAMRHGLPVIASVHDAAPEVNLEAVTGYNVDLRAPGQLADRIVTLLRDQDLARRLGNAGRERWRRHFTHSAFRARFSPLIDELLAI